MGKRRSLPFWLLVPCGASLLWLLGTGTPADSGEVNFKSPLSFTGDLLRNGLKLLKLRLVEINIEKLDLHLTLASGGGGEGQQEVAGLLRNGNELTERIGKEKNALLKQQLMIMQAHLEVDRERNQFLVEQNKILMDLYGHQVRILDFQKSSQQALMRREVYDVPLDKLVVVVADFSSGDATAGREVADEIGHHLRELTRYGINIQVLVGEIKPGVVIRNEEMAEDLGRHFKDHVNFVVVWGTMSPRTVGQFRPHITCVQKTLHGKGVAASFSLPLASEELPLRQDAEKYQRQCYERLIGVTCAAIPSCFAAHEISQERVPDLARFYELVGKDSNEAKKFREELAPLVVWSRVREQNGLSHVKRMSRVTAEQPFPATILNTRDKGAMLLITDENGQPKRFPGEKAGEEVIVYIDMLETTNRQYVQFLNEVGKIGNDGGVPWVSTKGEDSDVYVRPRDKGFGIRAGKNNPDYFQEAPIVGVSWFGADAYCKWAGKSLPRKAEWSLAAQPKGKGKYPWGENAPNKTLCNGSFAQTVGTAPVGHYVNDKSGIGCFDMAGNAAEWAEDWFAERKGEKVVCGGSHLDKSSEVFQVAQVRGVPQATHHVNIGFRGVLRVTVPRK